MFAFQNKDRNFGEWYRRVLFDADIVDQRYPVKGCVVWKGYGTKVMGKVMKILEDLLDETGHSKTYFPLLIPDELFGRESRHLRGFEEQVFWVTRAGKKRLSQRLVVRPTSETAMSEMFSLWIRSHKDLPMKVYQTVSVFRYETRATKPLLRDREMWPFNEAHTLHATLAEAEKQVDVGIEIYRKLFRRLALPYLLVRKPRWELFPGALGAFEFYVVMPDGKVLETGSVNNLGQAFSRVFGIRFEKADGDHEYAYQTSYGQTERLLASIIAVHGDDHGLVLPSSIAPILIVIVPIIYTKTAEKVINYAKSIKKVLEKHGFMVSLDLRGLSPGEKFYYWEKRGIPIRLEVGLQEVEGKNVTIVRRDTMQREEVPLQRLAHEIRNLINQIDRRLWNHARRALKENVAFASELVNAIKYLSQGKTVIKAFWCGTEKCRHRVEEQTETEIIGFPFDEKATNEACLVCGEEAREIIYLAKTH